MRTVAPDIAALWLSDLDSINLSWNITAFHHSQLGRPPEGLLESIVQYICKGHLHAVTRITPQFRRLVKTSL